MEMTNEEAIAEIKEASREELKFGDTLYHPDEVQKRIDAFDMAIKALGRQTPKEPIHTIFYTKRAGRKVHTVYCGVCGEYRERVYMGDKFCRECGTPIDWEETNDKDKTRD